MKTKDYTMFVSTVGFSVTVANTSKQGAIKYVRRILALTKTDKIVLLGANL